MMLVGASGKFRNRNPRASQNPVAVDPQQVSWPGNRLIERIVLLEESEDLSCFRLSRWSLVLVGADSKLDRRRLTAPQAEMLT